MSQVAMTMKGTRVLSPDAMLLRFATWVPALQPDELPDLRRALAEAAASLGEVRDGRVALFDYSFNSITILEIADSQAVRFLVVESGRPDESMETPLQADGPAQRNESSEQRVGGASILALPLRSGSREFGLLSLITPGSELRLAEPQRAYLEAFCGLAAAAFERIEQMNRVQTEALWLAALYSVFTAAREGDDIGPLLRTIAESVRKVSLADFVVLYEYFEEEEDVRLPPVVEGSLREPKVILERGIATPHEQSVLFSLIQRGKPFFAEFASEEWSSEGLASRLQTEQGTFFEREGVVSSAGFPLRPAAGGETVGILFVNYRAGVPFPPDFQEKLSLVANQAALAIGSMRHFMRAKRANRHLLAMRVIGAELGEAVSGSIEEIGRLIDERTQEILETKNLFLCLYRKEGERDIFSIPYLRDAINTREEIEPFLSRGLAAYVCRTGVPLLLSTGDQREMFARGEAELVGTPSAIWMGAPLIARGKVLGALIAQDYERRDAFDQQHAMIFAGVASQAAIAVDNYDLLRQERARTEELRIFLSLSEAFSRHDLSVTDLLSRALDYLCGVAEVSGSHLFLRLHDRQKGDILRVVATSDSRRDHLNQEIPCGRGICGRVMENGEPLIVYDYPNWGDLPSFEIPLPLQVCAVPLLLGDEPIGVMTLFSDSEEPKLGARELEILRRFSGPAALALRNARDASFRETLIEAGPYAIVAVDSHGRVSEFNNEAEKLFGLSASAIKGQGVENLYWDPEEAKRIGDELHARGRTQVEFFGRTGDGKKIPLLLAASPLRDEMQAVLGSVGILEDQRIKSLRGRTKRVVQALLEIDRGDDLETVLRATVDTSVVLLYAEAGALFISENDSLRFHYSVGEGSAFRANAESGVTASELGGMVDSQEIQYFEANEFGPLRLRPDAGSAVVVPLLTESRLIGLLVLESREPQHFEADRELVEALASQAAVSINRIQLLLDQEQTQKNLLVAANAILVGQIGTSFLHEAKNSLNAMGLSLLDLQQSLVSEGGLQEKATYIEQIQDLRDEVERFDLLSRRLQRFTQEGLRPEKKQCYLNDVIEQTTKLMRSALDSRGIRLHTKLDPSLDRPMGGGGGISVEIDEAQIQQVLMNLILNAMTASRDRTPLHIESRNLVDKEMVEMRVIDHGCGIADDVRPKLFQAFVTTKKDGVGLGLFLSRLLVEENHEGTIRILNSSVGRGTTFAVALPKRAETKARRR